MKLLISALVILTLAGCASIVDGVLGRYHNYDAHEYTLTVQMLHEARQLESACVDTDAVRNRLQELAKQTKFMITYTEGRKYNRRTHDMVLALDRMVTDTAARERMSLIFCRERSKNIVRAAEILRTASGEKPE